MDSAQSRLATVSSAKNAVVLTMAAVTALTLSGCGGAPDGPGKQPPSAQEQRAAQPEGTGKAVCKDVAIAYVGAITGPNAELGRNIHDGVDYALRRHNEANPKCQVELVDLNTEGLAAKAPGIVAGLVPRKEIVGVVGLPFSDESKRAGKILDQAGLVQITPSATNPGLAAKGWKTFFRGTGNDVVQAKAAVKFLSGELKKRRVCVVHERTDYGQYLAGAVQKGLGAKAECTGSVKPGQTTFGPVVDKIAKSKPDAVYFAGFYPEGGPFAKELAKTAPDAQFVGSDGVRNAQFVEAAGDGAKSAYFTCSCAPVDGLKGFAENYRNTVLRPVGTYSLEGFDAATVLLAGIDAGHQDRKSLLTFVGKYRGQGLSGPLEWDARGELRKPSVWVYKVEGNSIVRHAQVG